MIARILASIGVALLALLIGLVLYFFDAVTPNMLIIVLYWLLVLLMGAVATLLLYFAITGEGPL